MTRTILPMIQLDSVIVTDSDDHAMLQEYPGFQTIFMAADWSPIGTGY